MRLRALVAISLLLAGCGDSRSRLVVYSAHGRDILAEYEAAFEKAHPGVDVVGVYDGSRNLLARLRAEKSNPQASVWWGGDTSALRLAAKDGLLLPYEATFAATSKVEAAPDFAWTACFELPIALGYHPGRIDEASLPRTLEDLADPKYRGKLILRSPAGSGTMATVLSWIAARGAALEPDGDGFGLLRRIDANVATYEASPDLMFEKLEKGPASITIWNLTDLVFQHEVKGYSFVPGGFREPVPVVTDGIAIIRDGIGDPAMAKSFFEFVNSPDALTGLAQRHGRIPARPDFSIDGLSAGIRAVPYERFRFPDGFDDAARDRVVAKFQDEIRGRGR